MVATVYKYMVSNIKSKPFYNDKPQLFIKNILIFRKIDYKQLRNLCREAFHRQAEFYQPNETFDSKISYIISIILGSRRIKYDYFRFIVCDVLGEKLPDDTDLLDCIKFHSNFKNLRGQLFGRLTVIEPTTSDKSGRVIWKCKCTCGNEIEVIGTHLISGHTKSCSCLHKEVVGNSKLTHGMSSTPIYYVWSSMVQRCVNSNDRRYIDYGGRGITVCDRWLNSFENFYEDMGDRPEGMTLDRIDNDGNYEPGNCRWATNQEQARNQRNNLMFQDGEFLIDFASNNGINYEFARKCFHMNMTKENIISKHKEIREIIKSGIRGTNGRFVS